MHATGSTSNSTARSSVSTVPSLDSSSVLVGRAVGSVFRGKIDRTGISSQQLPSGKRTVSAAVSGLQGVGKTGAKSWHSADGMGVLLVDPQLADHEGHLRYRWQLFKQTLKNIEAHEGGLKNFAKGYTRFGVHCEANCTVYREWAPAAVSAQLFGDFNNWHGTYMTRDRYGVWSCSIPHNTDGSPGIPHGSRMKIRLKHKGGWWVDVLPAWAKYAVPSSTGHGSTYDAVHWDPPPEEKYNWKHVRPQRPSTLRIYEAHVGMSSKEPKVATYREFADEVVPRIAMRYNAVQLMAIQEHAYYGSFGYHVTNPFAVSSRCGTPEDLKYLIDKAHGLGMVILLDVVHSHISKNAKDGLAGFDMGQEEALSYFCTGSRGYHEVWDSRLLNYRCWEVLRYLLSNLRWWIEEYRFDGFRFDGVTAMLYHHHGVNFHFSGHYGEYFSTATNVDAVVYLMLANKLIHEILPEAISVAEDVSGMPVLCRPVDEGGIGFDYRLAMGIPDKWTELVREKRDEEWSMQELVHALTNRRDGEKTVAYVECHDQCLVGGQTLAFRLMGSEMWDNMSSLAAPSHVIRRGIALHKITRLLTMVLGGDAWLNFMGNEFGHPDWVDFPREGNDWSHERCRRQWNLVDVGHLRYTFLDRWDDAMMRLEERYQFMTSPEPVAVQALEEQQMIIVERDSLLFVFNFSPFSSYEDQMVNVHIPGRYRVVLDSDSPEFDGEGRVGHDVDHFTFPHRSNSSRRSASQHRHYVQVLAPSRTAVVYSLVDEGNVPSSN